MSIGPEQLAAVALLAVVAHGLKGLTGFGPATLFVPVASLLFGQPTAVAASGVLDATSGAALTAADRSVRRGREGLLTGAFMAAGTAAGVVALTRVPEAVAAAALVLAVLAGLAAVVDAGRRGPVGESRPLDARDGAAGLLAGFVGGLTGIGGPPLVVHLQRVLTPHDLRAVVTRVLLVAAVVRVATFLAVGDDAQVADALLLAAVCLPPQLAGLLAGTRLARRVSPARLAAVNGTVVAASVLLAALGALL
ncbi:TSUP family transporter [Streptomyces sp. S1A]|uniref:Probable membrane transporter protein n=1 Tax=Streptomyces chitinivorans TaxID=1257027 RepID=A0ABW7I0I3_9ACTN|nr:MULTISPECIES: TSUP family transporter [Streptomyces]MCG3039708.1 TSUP family transporter [Streptomyces sp. ICN903]MDH2410679.1 TSUP family transporter [Streptomyces chitinivorans]